MQSKESTLSSLKRKKDLVKMAEAKKMVAAFTWKSLEGTDHAVRLNSKSGRYQSAVLRLVSPPQGLACKQSKIVHRLPSQTVTGIMPSF